MSGAADGNGTRRTLTRRRFVLGATAVAAGGAAIGVGVERATSSSGEKVPLVALGAQPAGLPPRQHAWGATLARDADGNPISPRFDRLLVLRREGRTYPSPRQGPGGGTSDA